MDPKQILKKGLITLFLLLLALFAYVWSINLVISQLEINCGRQTVPTEEAEEYYEYEEEADDGIPDLSDNSYDTWRI